MTARKTGITREKRLSENFKHYNINVKIEY